MLWNVSTTESTENFQERNDVDRTSDTPLSPSPSPAIIVRAEEALIVLLVLALWVAAIALFFNRWGKIRMLEPYQPKFQQQHRASCPLVEMGGPAIQHRTFSKFNINCLADPRYTSIPSPHNLLRPRQNSVFVGSSTTMVTLPMNPPRRAKSAMDIQTLVLAECGPGYSGSMLPMTTINADTNNPSCSRLDTFRVTNV